LVCMEVQMRFRFDLLDRSLAVFVL